MAVAALVKCSPDLLTLLNGILLAGVVLYAVRIVRLKRKIRDIAGRSKCEGLDVMGGDRG